MDIALCSLDGNKLKYAGANNPLWLIREGQLIEFKADKQPIGQFDSPKPYTTHEIDLKIGDTLFIFSDGYVDQFGGPKGKKFKAKTLSELLILNAEKSMEEIKQTLFDSFESWKGSLEQVDDVCIIGVRV
jgi:serine phosphatase RsbU (regulator of sigma subunit)